MREHAKRRRIPYKTLQERIKKGVKSRKNWAQARQRLTVAEEEVLEEYCLQLEKWGSPTRISQLRHMAEELLQAKGQTQRTGKNWPGQFLKRHLILKSVFISPQDRNRQLSEDPEIITHQFELYHNVVSEHNIQPKDTYNIDEKGTAIGIIIEERCIVSKSEKQPKSVQDGNREWCTVIECISLKAQVLSPWIIFKAKLRKPEWFKKLKELREEAGEEEPGHICISDNGWTDNELGIRWLEDCFSPETSKNQKGEWRLLLWDGHTSHISSSAIRYCLENKIIPLYLLPHTTHLLQLCDVGLFGPEATLYKHAIARRCRPRAHEWIDKFQFLEVYCEIRPIALCQHNIEHAWRDSGLYPFDLNVVLSRPELRKKILTQASITLGQQSEDLASELLAIQNQQSEDPRPTSRPSTAQGPPLLISQFGKTPHNVAEVRNLIKQMQDQIIDQAIALDKLVKATERALTKAVITDKQNEDLVQLAEEKHKKKNKQDGTLRRARVMGRKVEGAKALEEALQAEFWKNNWEPKAGDNKSDFNLRFL